MAPMSYYTQKLSHLPLLKTNKVFVSFTGESTKANGKVEVNVQYGTYSGKLMLYIVENTKHILFGRDWLAHIPLNWKSLMRVIGCSADEKESVHRVSEEIVKKHEKLFDGKLGKLTHAKATVTVKEGAVPIRTKPHKVPYALKTGV